MIAARLLLDPWSDLIDIVWGVGPVAAGPTLGSLAAVIQDWWVWLSDQCPSHGVRRYCVLFDDTSFLVGLEQV